jgi:hypothetical protein
MLYYSQRLGKYKEVDPIWKLRGVAMPLNLLQTGPIVLVWVFLLTHLQASAFLLCIFVNIVCTLTAVFVFHYKFRFDGILDGISPQEVIKYFK